MGTQAQLELRLVGPLRLVRTDGTDLTPTSAKARGLLALLGTAPELRRSRLWLQDKLWSDRGPEQAAASLRQALVEVRRSLGPDRDCLGGETGWVALDPARVRVRSAPQPEDWGVGGEAPEFAAGLDVADPEFEHWIRDRRAAFEDSLAGHEPPAPVRAPEEPAAPSAPSTPAAVPSSRARRLRAPIWVAGLAVLLASVIAASALLRPDSAPEDPGVAARVPQDRPSIMVLPFAALGGDDKAEAFTQGVTRDIVTDLSRFGSLFVMAARSSARIAADLSGPRALTTDLGVRYVLTGSVQWLDDTVRVNTQLMETATGRHLWTERFDRPADDLLAVQNEISRRVVDVIGPVGSGQGKLRAAELERLSRVPTESLQAYDHYLQGVVRFDRGTPEDNLAARNAFAWATSLDPDYTKAMAMEAWTHLSAYWNGWTDTPERALARADALAMRAVEMDPGEPYAHWALGAVRLFQRRHDLALAAYRRSVELNPNGADLMVYLGWALIYAGEPDAGIAQMERAIARNPYHPGWYLWDIAWGHFTARRYGDAVAALEARNPKTPYTHLLLALSYHKLGRAGDAARATDAFRAADEPLTIDLARRVEPFRRPEDLQHYLDALRAVGIAETG